MEGNGVLWSMETSGEIVLGQLSILDVVSSLGTGQESVTTKDSIGGNSGALNGKAIGKRLNIASSLELKLYSP